LNDESLAATPSSIGKPSRHTTLAGIAMWLVLIGAFLAAISGGHFVFFFSREYRIGAALGALVLIPFFYRFIVGSSRQTMLARRSPAGVLRRRLLFAFGAAMAAAITVFAPLGWLLAATWMVGEPQVSIPATLLRVSAYNPGRGCDQSGVLAFEDRVASICLEGCGVLPFRVGQTVRLSGKQSALGFLVRGIATR
jgi:hypothetical protein